jgi:transposase-like protein
MTDTNVFSLVQPGAFVDSLTEVLRSGARALLLPSGALDHDRDRPGRRRTACARTATHCSPSTTSPAEHWKHLRTTNPIESTFATVRHRTVRSRGCLSNKTALAMIFKLAQAAEKRWYRLRGHNQLPKLIRGVKFSDGIEVVRPDAQTAAA